MKDLKLINTGGHRFHIDDLNHMQNGMKTMLNELASSLTQGNSTVLMHGAKITEGGGNTSITAGLAYIDSELFEVVAGTLSGTGIVDLEYQILEDYLAPSPVTYADLSSRNVHRYRYVVLGKTSARPGNYVQAYNPSAFTRLNDNWVKPLLGTDWINKDPNAEGLDVQYNFDQLQQKVELRGVCHYVTGAVPASPKLFTLPVGKRPATKVLRQIYVSSNMAGVGLDVNTNCACTINVNGDVSVDINVGAGLGYHLDGVYFYL